MSIRVWYHAGCADGFGAAWALWKKHGMAPIYEPVKYGEDPPIYAAGDEVWIVDFSYPRETLERLKDEVWLQVIDHHDTAAEDLAGLPYAQFTADKSGAVATWEHVHDEPVPELLLYIQDRDLWRFGLPHSKAINYAIRYEERSFERWDDLDVDVLRSDGAAMLRLVSSVAAGIAKTAEPAELAGHKILAVNGNAFASEVGHLLAARSPSGIGAVWSQRAGRNHWELRSREGGPHVGRIARRFGGGGHRHAAGFSVLWTP